MQCIMPRFIPQAQATILFPASFNPLSLSHLEHFLGMMLPPRNKQRTCVAFKSQVLPQKQQSGPFQNKSRSSLMIWSRPQQVHINSQSNMRFKNKIKTTLRYFFWSVLFAELSTSLLRRNNHNIKAASGVVCPVDATRPHPCHHRLTCPHWLSSCYTPRSPPLLRPPWSKLYVTNWWERKLIFFLLV